MNKNPGLMIAILAAALVWNVYDIFGSHAETPSAGYIIFSWILVLVSAVCIVGLVVKLVQQKNRDGG